MKKLTSIVLSALNISMLAQNNINISNYNFNNPYDDAEPYIAVSPVNSNYLIAAWMKVTVTPIMSIATSYSTDGGVTWSLPANMQSLHNNFYKADVSIAYNNSGTAYICFIDYDPAFDSGYVMVSNSTNNGQTWSQPVKAFNGLETPDLPVDRPWIAVDRSGGPNNGKIYITTKSAEAGAFPHHVWMKSSSDGGITWSPRLQIDNPSLAWYNSMGALDVGPEGNVYVGYMSYDTTQSPFFRILLKRSTDGGNTFSESLIAYPVGGSAMTDTLYQGSFCLKVNPTNGNNIICIVTDARNGDPDILCVRTTNGGTTWNGFTPYRVNDDQPPGNGFGQDMCWGGFSPNGIFCAVWRDRRNGGTSSSSNFEIWAAASTDGGATFKPSYKISSQSSPVIPIAKGNDFLGVAMDNSFLYTDWCDKRTGNTEIFTAKDTLAFLVSELEIGSFAGPRLDIFPNPASGQLHYYVQYDSDGALAEISLTDVQGKLIETFSTRLKAGNNEFERNIKLVPGNYLLKVQIGDNSVQKRFTMITEH